MRKSGKRVSHGKGYALSHPRSGELTCSEWQVDDVLSAGESTQEERSLPKEFIHQRPNILFPVKSPEEGGQ
jgi:hypothetical protein